MSKPSALAKVEEKARADGSAIVQAARQLVIVDDETYQLTVDFSRDTIKPAVKVLDDAFKPSIKDAHSLHKQLLATYKGLVEPFDKAEEVLSLARQKYRREVEERQRVEAERVELEMKAEAERLALEEAGELFSQGDEDAATQLLAQLADGQVEPIAPPPMVEQRVKASGLTVRKLKRFRVVNVNLINRQYLIPDLAAIQKVVNESEDPIAVVGAGIELFELESEAVRS